MIRGKKGGILIYMLGMITLLSIVVTEFLLETASAMRFRSQMAGRQDLELIADSALETSLAVLAELKELDKGLFSPTQGWGDPTKYFTFPLPEGYTLKVTIHDESGKLSIYEEDLTNFGNLLVEMGFSFEIVSNLKSELKKYLDKLKKEAAPNSSSSNASGSRGSDSNAPSSQRRNGGGETPRSPSSNEAGSRGSDSNAPSSERRNGRDSNDANAKKVRTLFNLEQLKEIPIFERTFFDEKGNPNDQFKVLQQNVSVLNTGKVNINTAPGLVKKILIGTLNTNAAGKKYLKSMQDFGPTRNQGSETNDNARFSFNASIFDIEIEVARGPIKYHLGAIMEDTKPVSDQQRNRGEQDTSAEEGGSTQSTPARSPRTGNNKTPPSGRDEAGQLRNSSAARSSSASNGRSEEKSDFSFLALTEDNSFNN